MYSGLLENNRIYKISNQGLKFVPAEINLEGINKWKEEYKEIPVIILEEKYSEFGGFHYQNLSGLKAVYSCREQGYGGPIIVLSLFTIEQVKIIIKRQPSYFKEKTERILLTSNIGFFKVTEEREIWHSQVKAFLYENNGIEISKFSIDDALSFGTSSKEAIRQIFHDLKNEISEKGFFGFESSIEPSLTEIENDYIKKSASKYGELKEDLKIKLKETTSYSKELEEFTDKLISNNLVLQESITQKDKEHTELNYSSYGWQVLIIEDDEGYAAMIQQVLSEFGISGYPQKNYSSAIKFLVSKEAQNPIWIISDYRLYLDKQSKKWEALQGVDLINEILRKLEVNDKKIHLTVITSKRNLLRKAIQELWNPPINFFDKSYLQTDEGLRFFIASQLPLLENADEYNNNYKLPDSWSILKDSALSKNCKKYLVFKEEKKLGATKAVEQFKLKYPIEAEQATFLALWNELKRDLGPAQWNAFNSSLNEEISENFEWEKRPNRYYANQKPTYPFIPIINRQYPKYKEAIKNRIRWRRILLVAIYYYGNEMRSRENTLNPTRFIHQLYYSELGNPGNRNNFNDAAAFLPDEILNSDFTINTKKLPLEERQFLSQFFDL